MKYSIRCIILILFLLLAACGRKGPLIPPEALVPAAVDTLRVEQKGWDFRVSWRAPGKEQSGRPLRDLAGFRLLRRQIVPGEPDCSACSDAWQLLATVDLDLPRSVQQHDGFYLYRDGGMLPGKAAQYRLVAFSKSGGVSRPATSPVRTLLPVPAAPSLKAGTTPTAITLELSSGLMTDSGFAGFNLYRRTAGEEPVPFPHNPAPITTPVYEDQRVDYGRSYRYSATVLVKIGDDLVESLPSAEVEVPFSLQEIR